MSTLLIILVALLLGLHDATLAHAQALRSWVSGVGDDANPCSRTAPCKTFAGAISKTAVNGEIDCIDPGGFGTVTITKSITIDCHQTLSSISNSGTNGINIPFDSFSLAGENRYTVRIRGLSFNGTNTGVVGIRITGTNPGAHAGTVLIEDVVIDGNFGGAGRGISDERTGGGELYVSNTAVRNTANAGIAIGIGAPAQRLDVALQNVRVQNSGYGLVISNGAMIEVDNSTFTGNTNAGIYAEGPNSASQMNVNNSVTSNNGTGIEVNAGATVKIANTDVTFNATAITGTVMSFTNNRISGNTAPGTAPTPIAPANTNPSGQQ
jgi:hypothetical protein